MRRTEHRLAFESFGLTAEVVVDDRRAFEDLPGARPPGWRPAHRSGAEVSFRIMRDGTITLDGRKVSRADGDRAARLAVLGATVRHHLAEYAPAHVFVHAGVVCAGGVAIVIPGSSAIGKTTLVLELLRAGARYYSDEYAVVDGEGMIHPYPKPLSIRSDPTARRLDGMVEVPEAQVGTDPIRAGLIVVTSYEQGSSWRPVARPRAEGALVLLEHTVAARSRPKDALAAVRRMAQQAQVITGVRGEASAVAQALLAGAVMPR